MKTEEKLLALAGAINLVKEHAIIMLNPEGTIETWSQGAEHIYGYAEKEVLGKPLSVLFQAEPTTFPQLFNCAKKIRGMLDLPESPAQDFLIIRSSSITF